LTYKIAFHILNPCKATSYQSTYFASTIFLRTQRKYIGREIRVNQRYGRFHKEGFFSVLYVCFIVGAFCTNAECQDTNSVSTSGGPRTQEFHDICSDCGQKRVDLGEHDFCALTGFVIGGFNSRCNVGRSGSRWYMDITDPGPPDPWQGESQECKATCFTFSR
jgi:hypothetical protein